MPKGKKLGNAKNSINMYKGGKKSFKETTEEKLRLIMIWQIFGLIMSLVNIGMICYIINVAND